MSTFWLGQGEGFNFWIIVFNWGARRVLADGPLHKLRRVAAFGDNNLNRFIDQFCAIEFFKLLPQVVSASSDGRIFSGRVTFRTPEDAHADGIFGRR